MRIAISANLQVECEFWINNISGGRVSALVYIWLKWLNDITVRPEIKMRPQNAVSGLNDIFLFVYSLSTQLLAFGFDLIMKIVHQIV